LIKQSDNLSALLFLKMILKNRNINAFCIQRCF
jgi:hypothetical protein